MLESWADLYGVTGKQAHADLMERYERRRLFRRLLKTHKVGKTLRI